VINNNQSHQTTNYENWVAVQSVVGSVVVE